VTTCQILAKLIAESEVLVKLNFADCMLPAMGFAELMNGLKKNSSIKEIDLSSNNLQASAAVHIGTFLRQSKTVAR
jgi:Ran GTPase-activating protein (RanGAP) involved in mRNA processing and transport